MQHKHYLQYLSVSFTRFIDPLDISICGKIEIKQKSERRTKIQEGKTAVNTENESFQ